MKRALTGALALVLLGGSTTGCHGSTARPRATDAVAAVLASRAGEGFGFFPHHAGRRRCRIPEGGPGRKPGISGVCTTNVRVLPGHSGQTAVVFVQTWPWRLFHYAGSVRRRQRHAWTFVVFPGGKTKVLRQGGDFPPQFVM